MKAIVVGAGVLGASIAYQLAKRGVSVTVLDKGAPGQAASAASFAWLNSNSKELRPYHDLNVISIAEWSVVARDLQGSRWLHNNVGNVHVADTPGDAEKLTAKVQRLQSYGYAAVPLVPEELRKLDSVIRVHDNYELAALFPLEGYITVPLLIHDLLRKVGDLGGSIVTGANVVDLLTDDGKIRGTIVENGDRLESDVVILAAGAGIGKIMSSQGADFRTKGSLGATITTSPGTSNLSTILHLPQISIRPEVGGRLVIRSSKTDHEIDLDSWTVPDTAVYELVENTAKSLTDVNSDAVRSERIQVAARPYPLDGLPVVGHWDGYPGLYVMSMHSGVTMGAIIGRLAAEEITTEVPAKLLDGFRPARVIEAEKDGIAYFDPYAIEGENRFSRA